MEGKDEKWAFKLIVKVALAAFVATGLKTLLDLYLLPQLPAWAADAQAYDSLLTLVVALAFAVIMLRQRFFGKVRTLPKSSPLEVHKLIVEVGGMVKGQKASVDHKKQVETWLSQNIKIAQIPSLIEAGELQFTTPNGAYDLLVDFIELKDGSDKTLETIMVSKGNKEQIDFFQQLSRCKLQWRCDHINVNGLTSPTQTLLRES